MHHIYTTKAIILRREIQDTSAYYYLLTENVGLIKARAQGIRGVKSKLKGSLQEFSLSTVAFVRGRVGWKITTAIPERNFFMDSDSNSVRKIIARISDVLIRFIVGEEINKNIFMTVENGFTVLLSNEVDQSIIESIILARILYLLGYVDFHNLEFLFKDFSDFNKEIVSLAGDHKSLIIKSINKGFKESQL